MATKQKNVTRDKHAGRELAAWMKSQNLTDGALAKRVGASSATVATWRHGTRPSRKYADSFEKVVGWNFDSPPNFKPGALPPEPDETAKTTRRRRTARTAPTINGAKLKGILLAHERVKQAITEGRVLNPSDAEDLAAMQICMEALDAESLRERDPHVADAIKLYGIVSNNPQPFESLGFLREHANFDAIVLDAVEARLRARDQVVATA